MLQAQCHVIGTQNWRRPDVNSWHHHICCVEFPFHVAFSSSSSSAVSRRILPSCRPRRPYDLESEDQQDYKMTIWPRRKTTDCNRTQWINNRILSEICDTFVIQRAQINCAILQGYRLIVKRRYLRLWPTSSVGRWRTVLLSAGRSLVGRWIDGSIDRLSHWGRGKYEVVEEVEESEERR